MSGHPGIGAGQDPITFGFAAPGLFGRDRPRYGLKAIGQGGPAVGCLFRATGSKA
jgi:hypothetical protein